MNDRQFDALLTQLTDLNINLGNVSVLLEALVRVQLGILNSQAPDLSGKPVLFEEIINKVAESQQKAQEQTIDKQSET